MRNSNGHAHLPTSNIKPPVVSSLVPKLLDGDFELRHYFLSDGVLLNQEKYKAVFWRNDWEKHTLIPDNLIALAARKREFCV
jgi:hypothetical protein